MHLIWENVVKNLMHLWTGQYKGLDTGTEEYEIQLTVWEAIGQASAKSGDTIPGIYGPRPPNVASDKMSWTADTRSFWFQYVGPVLLARRFKHRKYYDHFVSLVQIIRLCLQFEITTGEVQQIREGLIQWVLKYEKMYYQHNPERLPMCPLTIHALLHIADSIEMVGPVWASWAFPMERYCGALQPAIRSRRFPYSSLNRYVVDRARLDHLKLIYAGLDLKLRLSPEPSHSGVTIPGYETCVLLPPKRPLPLDRGLQDKILSCLCTRLKLPPARLRCLLPSSVEQYGKVRIFNDGDTIRAAALAPAPEDGRDATYVRYELLVDRNARYHHREEVFEKQTFFGQLLHVFALTLTANPIPNSAPPGPLLLAAVQTCVVEETNEDLDIHYYSRMGATAVVDISTIQCVVGRIFDRNRWAIIDRSGSLSRALYLGENGDT
ncbi:hypothetical protein C8T65DRAFT_586838 [Cerioporus squamosus]|nr:hypothetical protein C8T65DRAFT_586838 [Cerioporus squamosus]